MKKTKQDDENILDINDPAVGARDEVHALVDLRKGHIKEVPCGPINAAHLSGDRPVVWSKELERAVIPTVHRGRYRFYADFCVDPKVNAGVELTPAQGRAYYQHYAEFMRQRGHGSSAKLVEDIDMTKLLHPALMPIRARAKSARGQVTVDQASLNRLLESLETEVGANAGVVLEPPSHRRSPDEAFEEARRILAGIEHPLDALMQAMGNPLVSNPASDETLAELALAIRDLPASKVGPLLSELANAEAEARAAAGAEVETPTTETGPEVKATVDAKAKAESQVDAKAEDESQGADGVESEAKATAKSKRRNRGGSK